MISSDRALFSKGNFDHSHRLRFGLSWSTRNVSAHRNSNDEWTQFSVPMTLVFNILSVLFVENKKTFQVFSKNIFKGASRATILINIWPNIRHWWLKSPHANWHLFSNGNRTQRRIPMLSVSWNLRSKWKDPWRFRKYFQKQSAPLSRALSDHDSEWVTEQNLIVSSKSLCVRAARNIWVISKTFVREANASRAKKMFVLLLFELAMTSAEILNLKASVWVYQKEERDFSSTRKLPPTSRGDPFPSFNGRDQAQNVYSRPDEVSSPNISHSLCL